MSDLKPGTLVKIDPEQWPLTAELDGMLWVYMRELEPRSMYRYRCKSVATGYEHDFDFGSLEVLKEQTNAET